MLDLISKYQKNAYAFFCEMRCLNMAYYKDDNRFIAINELLKEYDTLKKFAKEFFQKEI